jgi:cytochrome b subunit of formate dehydrogenase
VTPTKAPDNDLCLSCHSDVGDKIKKQVHGAVACQSCHVKHEEYPHPEGVPKPACATCHSNMAKDYARSAHAQAVKSGNGAAPDCATCHGKAHELESTKTTAFRSAVPQLCGACHADIAEQYNDSVHGRAIQNGIVQAPVCTDCHGEHSILPPKDAASSVNGMHVRDTCGGCHNSVALSRRFGLPSDRIVSFDASYHGLASKSGAQIVANCASCHGVHNILPSADPKSTVNAKNLAATCGRCHPGAGQRFAIGPVHFTEARTEPVAVGWVRRFYLWTIPITIGLMLLHNAGDWARKLYQLRFRRGASAVARAPGEPQFRMFAFERAQHALLAGSFLILVWSGFALKYPTQWWARPMLFWEGSSPVRSIVHRTAAAVFIAVTIMHAVSLAVSRELRHHWRELVPAKRDISEAVDTFGYNLGVVSERPALSSHSYVEKAEYWAVVWGAVVMILSGVMLWANSFALAWLPKSLLDVATAVHFYEAVLATLAILVWHFYSVIFDPDVYPLDTAAITGFSTRPRSVEAETAETPEESITQL